ncbi:hypothetical protein [Bradyrhizobium cajani]|uniref:Uncharacterized protein n=1 Tax=Bradyrhizobium cajani TaxID=1928661 RepID=A0A844SZZ4_9BRAD|nr:hypothetical protein [Bradyrhizobium cajani]MCP3371136.1 hypothetical protein [Bradyrhizobium cajani]MVT72483.1 hypothetical protein [Bradyrhizobium cajani]
MPASRLNKFLAAASLSLALAVLAHPGAAFAYTQEEQQACSPDAMRLCGEFVPNVDAITACMIKKKAQLSPQCRVFFRPGPEPGERRAGKPTNIAPKSAKKSAKPAAKASRKKSGEG